TSYNWLHDSDVYHNLTSSTPDLLARRIKIANILDRLIAEKKFNLNFIPTVKIDHEGYQEIQKLMSFNKNTSVSDFSNDIYQVFNIISQSHLLVGMRLHSLILSSLLGKPIVPISYC